MANLVFDFLHNYKTGERRESDPADAYQYDEGHVFEAVVPVAVTSCEIHYWARGFDEAEAYTPASITQNTDNSYTITGNIPNKFFETYGDLRVYIVVTDGDASITTYEGRIHICERSKPDDYVDDDPENEATRVLVEAQEAAATATQKAADAATSAEQAAESARTLTLDTTLTQSGQAADAKAAGDAINDLKEDYTTLLDSAYVTDTASGSIASFPDGADGVPVKSLMVNVEPVQDLHGYDSPWPAGGGKNLMRYPYTSTSGEYNGLTVTVNTDGSITINGTATTGTHINLINGRSSNKYIIPDGNYILSGAPSASTKVYIYLSLMKNSQYVVSDIATTKTTATPSFTINGQDYDSLHCGIFINGEETLNNVTFYPMIRLSSASSTFVPFSNVCPISGHTTAKVQHTGKNFIKYPYETNGSTSNGITFAVNADGMITMNGTSTAAAYFRIADDRSGGRGTFKLPAGNYVLSDGLSTPSNNYNIYMSVVNGSTVVMPDIALSNTRQNFTIPEDLEYTHFRVGIVVQSGQTLNNLVFKPMIRLATDTDATYEPYSGQTVTIDLDGTIYGGTLDVTTGVMTVDRKLITVNGSNTVFQAKSERTDIDEYYITLNDGYLFDGTARYVPTAEGIEKGMICNAAIYTISDTNYPQYTAYVGSSGTKLQVRYRFPISFGIDTIAKANEYAASTNIQFIYPLATPTTVQLTANEISTLLGQNNIWNDCGDTEVTYRADTKLYIQKVLNA